MATSIIFIGSPERSSKNISQNFRQLFRVKPNELIFRIFAAFVPPFCQKYQKIYVDLLGPLLALLLLTAFVNYGSSLKAAPSLQSPTETILTFCTLMPLLSFILCKVGYSGITIWETTSLIGYALYGHIFTLFVSFLCFEESNNFFFFVSLIIFGGFSTLRVALVCLGTITVPGARLVVCSIISIINILFAIFLHFAYMHRTFPYKVY